MSGARSAPPSATTREPAAPTALPRLKSVRESPLVGRNQCRTTPIVFPIISIYIVVYSPRFRCRRLPSAAGRRRNRTGRSAVVRVEQLEYIAAVARLGSFRRAAEAVHVSQPALSESVRALERELKVDLLERGRLGARVSDSGRDLLPHIQAVLDAVDGLRD